MCGAIRYRIEQPPRIAVLCHCTDCRKACGAQSVAWITVPVRAFAFIAGEPIRFRSSPKLDFVHRCRLCAGRNAAPVTGRLV
jgi:hypothetical protein